MPTTAETVAGLAGVVSRSPVTPGVAEDIIALIDDENRLCGGAVGSTCSG